MEIACDILKKSSITERYSDIKKNFKSLNLNDISRTSSLETFIKIINTEKYINNVTSLIEEYFDNIDKDMGISILMAYCISSYSNKLFDSYKTKFEQKLILSANRVVLCIEKLLSNNKIPDEQNEDFLNSIDHYYSLYKVWKSKDSINEMSRLFENIQDITNILKIQIIKKMPIGNYNCLFEPMDKLFDLNVKYAIRILLHNYNIFDRLSLFETKFWESVTSNYQKYKDAIFVILVVELRIQLIPQLINPQDRKELYYNLDTEDIINKIRNSDLDNHKIIKIINLLQNKTNKINESYKIKKLTYKITDNELIETFQSMFYHVNNINLQ